MENFYEECPRKVFVKQLFDTKIPSPVWINGKIEQTVGTSILIINDETGRVKISNCDSVNNSPGDKSWIVKGSRCCVIGMLIKSKGLPEVSPLKLIHISQDEVDSWISEVEELNLFLEGKILPDLDV